MNDPSILAMISRLLQFALVPLGVLGIFALFCCAIAVVIARTTGKGVGLARGMAIGLLVYVPIPLLTGAASTVFASFYAHQLTTDAPPEIAGEMLAAGITAASQTAGLGLCASLALSIPAALNYMAVPRRSEGAQSEQTDEND